MRKIVFGVSVSRDGFFEGRGGALDWLGCSESARCQLHFLLSHDTIFYGRKAYEKVGIVDRIDTGIPPFAGNVHFVFGSSPPPPAW